VDKIYLFSAIDKIPGITFLRTMLFFVDLVY
jgi:hypothetical protein